MKLYRAFLFSIIKKMLWLLPLFFAGNMMADNTPSGLTLFNSDISFSPNIGLLPIKQDESIEFASRIKDYIKDITWPTIKNESQTWIRDVTSEIVEQGKRQSTHIKNIIDDIISTSIKKLFIATAGLMLIAIGGQIIKKTLSSSTKKNPPSKRIVHCTVGTGLIALGATAIVWCDRFSTQ